MSVTIQTVELPKVTAQIVDNGVTAEPQYLPKVTAQVVENGVTLDLTLPGATGAPGKKLPAQCCA